MYLNVTFYCTRLKFDLILVTPYVEASFDRCQTDGAIFGNAFGKTFRRGSGVTPLRGYFKTSAGIFAAGHFAKPWVRVFVTTIFAVAGTQDIPA